MSNVGHGHVYPREDGSKARCGGPAICGACARDLLQRDRGPLAPTALTRAEQHAEEPIEVGWYAYSGGRQIMIFHLRESRQWSVHMDNGTASDCAWGYIEQALGVWDLVLLGPVAIKAAGA